VRAAVEHVFAHQKGPMGLVVRTIGLARARVKIGLANLTFNMKRMLPNAKLGSRLHPMRARLCWFSSSAIAASDKGSMRPQSGQ
jgi:hypothetical protein